MVVKVGIVHTGQSLGGAWLWHGWTATRVVSNLGALRRASHQQPNRGRGPEPEPPPADPSSAPLNGRRRAWFRLLAAVAVPLAALLAVEAALRLAGFGYAPGFFKNGHREGQVVRTENRDFGRRFFPPGLVRYAQPLNLPTPKGTNTLRVFVLGESAALGDPDLKFGLPKMLEALLRERFPARRIEVVKAAMVAINSHVILPIARDCAREQADLWVIYMGNNEVIGPFGSASVFGARAPSLPFVRAGLWLKTTRVGQLLDAVLSALRRGRGPWPEWKGMEMMAQQRVRYNAPSTRRVHQHFERNLREILAAGARAGIPVVLCTVPTNEKDCAPFGSLHRTGFGAEELREWEKACDSGGSAQQAGDYTNAMAAYERAARIDDDFAELLFRRAQCCQALGQDQAAAKLFRRARDQDALQFRADSRINETIRQAADACRNQQVWLVDAEKLFAEQSPRGLVGEEYFYEHVHLRPEGNYLLARAVAQQAVRALGQDAAGPWLSQSECWQRLGLTDWNRYDALNVILDRIQSAPFTGQVNHAEQVQRLQAELARYRMGTKPAQVRREATQLAALVGRYPEDPDLHWNLASLLESAGDPAGAESQWRELIRLQPQAALPQFNLAKLLERVGRPQEALVCYRQCLALDPGYRPAREAVERAADGDRR